MSVWTWGRPRNVTVKKPERSEKADRRIGRMFPAWNDKGSTAESQSAKAARLWLKSKNHIAAHCSMDHSRLLAENTMPGEGDGVAREE